jgi:ATP adenylyltransferase
MEIKFTPWRMNYIKGGSASEQAGCVLCNLPAAATAEDAANLLLYRGRRCYVVMNLYPYNTAHLMVVPYLHTADLAGLAAETAHELFGLTRHCVAIIEAEYHPHGYNLGMNLGRTAGAGIDEHLHMHIVPRWNGDANYLPIVGGTKLLPEELPRSYERLRPHFAQLEQVA